MRAAKSRRGRGLSHEERLDSLVADIDALPAARVNIANAAKVEIDFILSAYGIVVEAARARRLSVPAFVRRAAYAMACHDLELPLQDALDRDPRMTRETGFPVRDPEGTRFGDWEIQALRKAPVDGS